MVPTSTFAVTHVASGWIMRAARRDRIRLVVAVFGLLAAVVGLLWLNRDYIYNVFRGPFDFTPALAANPGRRAWVRSSGPLTSAVLQETVTVEFFKGLARTTSVSAQYLAQAKDGKFLIVKILPGSSQDPLVGELVPLPTAITAELGSVPRERLQPFLLDTTHDYYSFWSPYNLFVLLIGAAGVFLVPAFVVTLSRTSPQFHQELRALSSRGPIPRLVSQIESDLARWAKDPDGSRFHHSPTWVVWTEPVLGIVHRDDLVAIAPSATVGATAKPVLEIQLYRRGRSFPSTVTVGELELRLCLRSVAERFPWAIQDDAKAFSMRWAADPKQCEADVASRRALREAEAVALLRQDRSSNDGRS